jgi:outer membrane lipoprotein carrier protein
VSRNWLFLVAIQVCAFGANPPLDALFKGVEARYNHAQSLQVFFHESYTAPQRPKRTESGTLRLHKPGRMRWDYTDPAGKLFLSDGKNVYLYTPANNEVEKFKMKESEDMRVPLAFLLGKLNFDKDFQGFQSRQEGDLTWIVAKPKSDNLPYTKVEFAVNADYQIRRVQVTGYDQSITEFAFDQEKVNPPMDSKVFRFQLPAGAKLMEDNQ